MPQGVEVVETGRVMTDRGRLVLLRDDGGAWGLFLEQDPRDWLGQRVTIRGRRYGFANLHVTGIVRGDGVPPPEKTTGKLISVLVAIMVAIGGVGLLWSLISTLWSVAEVLVF